MTGNPTTGPAPAAEDARRLSDARRRVLSVVASASEAGVTVADVAQVLGGHPNASRAHLQTLLEHGLIIGARAEPTGRGRPAQHYRISPTGRQVLDGRPDAAYRTLTSAFANHLAQTGDAQSAKDVGRLWARAIAERQDETIPTDSAPADHEPTDTTERLIELLASLDFTPTLDESGEIVLLHTCPFVEEARQNPAVICRVHQGLVDGALESWGLADQVRLQPFSGPGVCRLLLHASPLEDWQIQQEGAGTQERDSAQGDGEPLSGQAGNL